MSTATLPISRARVIGTGLLGTSIALGLREHAVEVDLDDSSPSRLRLAEDYGAGQPVTPATPDPDLVLVATPPDVTAAVVSDAVNRFPEARLRSDVHVMARFLNEKRRTPAGSNFFAIAV